MKHTINKFLLPLLAAAAAALGACSDWTDTESLDIKYPSIDKQNPELYGQYLEALRSYKAGDHKVLIAGMPGRSTAPGQQNEHLTTIPDSVDYICLTDPADLHPQLMAEIAQVHEKGTRVVYDIDFETIEKTWKRMMEEEEAAKPAPDPETPAAAAAQDEGSEDAEGGQDEPTPEQEQELRFRAFCREQTLAQLAFCDRFGFDGIVFSYKGRSPQGLDEASRAVYAARQQAFLTPVAEWHAAHADKLLFFRGYPQNLLDATLLADCRYIIIPVLDATSADELSFHVLMACIEGVPTDRFVAGVTIPSVIDPSNENGYFAGTEADGKTRVRATKGAAQWVNAPGEGFTKAGLSVNDAHFDYYNIDLVYKNIREAIFSMNPAPKN